MMKIRYALIAVAAVMLAGCTSVRSTYLSDGSRGYVVGCRHFFSRWSSCVMTAGKICGSRGYTIRYGDEFDRELVVACTARQEEVTSLRGQ